MTVMTKPTFPLTNSGNPSIPRQPPDGLKLACLMSSVSRRNGGIFEAERQLCRSLVDQHGTNVEVFSIKDEHTAIDLPDWGPVGVHTFPAVGPPEFAYSPRLRAACLRSRADILQVAGLWTYSSMLGLNWSRRTRKPRLVTPHGMLDPWALRQSAWKKRIAARLFEEAHLREATVVRALCPSEKESFQALGLRNPVCVIPNGVTLPESAGGVPGPAPCENAMFGSRQVLLYLGRIHPKKGLDLFLSAMARLKREHPLLLTNWAVVIAGWGSRADEEQLRSQIGQLELDDDVRFVGSLFGAGKQAAFRNAAAFILPSLSEGLPMAVLEAWSYSLPVLMTEACHLTDGFMAGAACRITADIDRLAGELADFFRLDDERRVAMGRAGRSLVEEQYTWSHVARQMHAVYARLAGTPAATWEPELESLSMSSTSQALSGAGRNEAGIMSPQVASALNHVSS